MVEQYPDSIVVSTYAAPTQDVTTLKWTAGAKTAEYTFSCRAEMNTSGRKIAGVDGSLVEYAFAVYMPRTDVIILPESAFTLTSDRFGSVTGKVKWSMNGQLNSRLWL